MSKRMPVTSTKLFEITAALSESRPADAGITSAEVVDRFLEEIEDIPDSEKSEALRMGLMVLAGRVPMMIRANIDQTDILAENGFPHFVSLRIPDAAGRIRTRRFNVRRLTPNMIIKHQPRVSLNNKKSTADPLFEWAAKQIAAGFGDVSVENS